MQTMLNRVEDSLGEPRLERSRGEAVRVGTERAERQAFGEQLMESRGQPTLTGSSRDGE